MAKLYQVDVEIIDNKSILPYYKLLVLRDKKISEISQPGQFVTILTSRVLRRPFCISLVKKDRFEVLYKIVGEGTKFLSQKSKGDCVNVIGPLGNGYKIRCNLRPVLVAGGTGIASLRFLAQKLPVSGLLLYGAKTKNEIIGLDIFKQKKWKIEISTEDGSFGYKCKVTDLLKRFFRTRLHAYPRVRLYASGPVSMLKQVSNLCHKFNVEGEISLEKIIACGVGACRGCVIETKNGQYKTVCKDGPVFDVCDVVFSG